MSYRQRNIPTYVCVMGKVLGLYKEYVYKGDRGLYYLHLITRAFLSCYKKCSIKFSI